MANFQKKTFREVSKKVKGGWIFLDGQAGDKNDKTKVLQFWRI